MRQSLGERALGRLGGVAGGLNAGGVLGDDTTEASAHGAALMLAQRSLKARSTGV